MKIKNFTKVCKFHKIPLQRIKLIESILSSKKGKLYLVGGVVRDLILKTNVSPVPDLVCDLPITTIVSLLKKNKIQFSSVGIDYGSIVIQYDFLRFDLTSMRKDLVSYGRHAEVSFSPNLDDDSARRDFTVNAIYCDTNGNIIDPQNGLKDLNRKKGPKIRFIGDSEERIKEDFLRILRFLRFSLYYSRTFDLVGLNSCKKFIKSIQKLSFERRIGEAKKIIVLKNLESEFVIKKIYKFLEFCLDCKLNFKNFINLCLIEKKINDISFERRIKLLIRKKKIIKIKFVDYLEKKVKERITTNFKLVDFSENLVFYSLYKYPKEIVLDALIFGYLNKKISKKKLIFLVKEVKNFKLKDIPIDGNDLIRLGFKKGKIIGQLLDKTKKWWLKKNCLPNKKECESFVFSLFPTSRRR